MTAQPAKRQPLATDSNSSDPRRRLGAHGEKLAQEHLERLGFVTVCARARTRWGEIDLIVHSPKTLVFCEVKTRSIRGGVEPWTSLHDAKQRRLRRLAASWLAETPDRPRAKDLRFDAITVVVDRDWKLVRLDHHTGAF